MILYNHDHNSDYVRILINFNMHLWIIRFKYIYAHTTFWCTMIIKFKFLMTFTEVSFTCHKMCPLYEYSSMILKINVYIYAAVTTIQCWCISITPPILSNSFMFPASTPGKHWSAFCLWYHSFIHIHSFIHFLNKYLLVPLLCQGTKWTTYVWCNRISRVFHPPNQNESFKTMTSYWRSWRTRTSWGPWASFNASFPLSSCKSVNY